MNLNGVDLNELTPDEQPAFPSMKKGRWLHLDGDTACYKVTYDDEVPLSKCLENFLDMTDYRRKMAGAEFLCIHLTGHDKGGRLSTSTVKKYQGNRDGKVKPKNLNPLRQILLERHSDLIVFHENQEADDGMTQANHKAIQNGERLLSVIMAEDKDLDMAQGLHCDWNTFEINDVVGYGKIWMDDSGSTKKLKGFGTSFFWAQLLMGDSADNIPGCEYIGGEVLEEFDPLKKPNPKRKPKKCGPGLAYKILFDCNDDHEALYRVLECYRSYYGDKYTYTSWTGQEITRTASEMLLEQARLLWMRRVPDECPRVFFKEVLDNFIKESDEN